MCIWLSASTSLFILTILCYLELFQFTNIAPLLKDKALGGVKIKDIGLNVV